jgi:hypothetical protein
VILSEGHISRDNDAQEAHVASTKLNDMKALGLVLYLVLGGKYISVQDDVKNQDSKDKNKEEQEEEFDQSAKRGRGTMT